MNRVVDGVVIHLQLGLLDHPSDMVGQHVAVDEAELQVLGAASNGGHHLVGLGGAKHEHHMVGGFFECLQQGILSAGSEHVDLVQHVHLGLAGRAHRHPGDEVADIVHLVVGGGVELDQVVGGVVGDVETRLAATTGLAVGTQIGAVEGFGQDAGGAGLAGASWAAEQVGMADAPLLDRILKGSDHRFLPAQFGEATRSVASIQCLEGHCADFTQTE